jgi:hypothetical protein
VEFADGSKVNTKEIDYKLIKPLIWWEWNEITGIFRINQ